MKINQRVTDIIPRKQFTYGMDAWKEEWTKSGYRARSGNKNRIKGGKEIVCDTQAMKERCLNEE